MTLQTTIRETIPLAAKGNGVAEPDSDFAQALLEKIGAGELLFEVWTITPDMAKVMLRWNDRNRPEGIPKQEVYTRIMTEARWVLNGVPVIFSTERLLDGQNRLRACIKSNKNFETLVVFGVSDTAFDTIDVGRGRSAADIFSINGVANATVLAAASKWVWHYEQGGLGGHGGSYQIDHAALYEFYRQNPKLNKSVWVAEVFKKSRMAMPSIMVGVHYVCAQKHRKKADEFFRCVGDGVGLADKKEPAYFLRRRLLENAISQEKMGRKQIAALTIKAWNHHRLDREIRALTFKADEKFPKAI